MTSTECRGTSDRDCGCVMLTVCHPATLNLPDKGLPWRNNVPQQRQRLTPQKHASYGTTHSTTTVSPQGIPRPHLTTITFPTLHGLILLQASPHFMLAEARATIERRLDVLCTKVRAHNQTHNRTCIAI